MRLSGRGHGRGAARSGAQRRARTTPRTRSARASRDTRSIRRRGRPARISRRPSTTRSASGSVAARSRKVCAPEVDPEAPATVDVVVRRAAGRARADGQAAAAEAGTTARGRRGDVAVGSRADADAAPLRSRRPNAASAGSTFAQRMAAHRQACVRPPRSGRAAGQLDAVRTDLSPASHRGCAASRQVYEGPSGTPSMTAGSRPARVAGAAATDLWKQPVLWMAILELIIVHVRCPRRRRVGNELDDHESRRGSAGVEPGELIGGEDEVRGGRGVDDRRRPGRTRDRQDDVGLREVPGQRRPGRPRPRARRPPRRRRAPPRPASRPPTPRRTGSTAARPARRTAQCASSAAEER